MNENRVSQALVTGVLTLLQESCCCTSVARRSEPDTGVVEPQTLQAHYQQLLERESGVPGGVAALVILPYGVFTRQCS